MSGGVRTAPHLQGHSRPALCFFRRNHQVPGELGISVAQQHRFPGAGCDGGVPLTNAGTLACSEVASQQNECHNRDFQETWSPQAASSVADLGWSP
ncbi:hypothetical protein P7K49_039787 [Saguinus oedipus]|uniref:Uncharacterized protein n=1 Tax=Saguinus oedipus TaxID=9490 RepID=A0ABQ9TC73_SAGOE|nr:hypothetical protein P7K49_039787 [Saguinus oedipus]